VLHGCYQNSRKTTAVAAGMIAAHKLLGTWSHVVDRYIALTEFARKKFIEGGLPAEKIVVKPNFIDPDPGCGDGQGGYALFAGRLAPEKGIATLIGGWDRLGGGLTLHVAGDGPLAGQVREAASRNPRIVWLGALRAQQMSKQMQGARFLVCPSVWYESFGLVIVEAFATGLPVVGSDLGAMAELIENERTGLLFPPGDEAALARAVQSLIDRPALLAYMRGEARREYEQYYTASRNYEILMSIYRNAKQQLRTPPIEGQTFDDYRTIRIPGETVAKHVR
jgi:glycosyltransferase involved in cell wall biosynthesis